MAIILAVVPFQAFVTTWAGSTFGHLDAIIIWKEVLLMALVPLVLVLSWRHQASRHWFTRGLLARLLLAYALLNILLGFLALWQGNVNGQALIYALLINLRFLGFFALVLIVAAQDNLLQRYWQRILLIPAGFVVVFGLLQRLVLPYDFLKHFGYSPNTVPAYQTVDQKLNYQRIQSTLRGANPLGAYLVLLLPLIAVFVKRPVWRYLYLFAGVAVLFFTYSRSAWLGIAVTGALLLLWAFRQHRRKITAVLGIIVLMFLLVGGITVQRHNALVQNTFFHTDDNSLSNKSSNTARVQALKEGWHDIIHQPFGRGPGTAGPASTRNNHPARIAENYYLQLGQELGLLGLGLFVAINTVVAIYLWCCRQNALARILFFSLIGLTLVNMVSHAWTDDTLAYLWWGLAGIALAPSVILSAKDKTNVSSQKERTKRS